MAVAADTVAGVFLALLMFFGYSAAFKDHKPLIMPSLLILPVLGVVLSFAARRTIRNSEGTRTGEGLANTAWWVSIIGGLGYATYLFAIEYTVRHDANNELKKWVGHLIKPKDEADFYEAFRQTLEPGRRGVVNPEDPKSIELQFRDRVTAFKQADLVRFTRRNPGKCEFIPGTLKDWVYRPFGIECVFTGTLKCPEGSFPVQIPLVGAEAKAGSEETGGRQWMVIVPQHGFMDPEKISVTPYGWRINQLEKQAADLGQRFVNAAAAGPDVRPYVYQAMMGEPGDVPLWDAKSDSTPARWAVGSCLASAIPISDKAERLKPRLFRLAGGGEPSAEQKAKFMEIWNTLGIQPPGRRIPGNEKLDMYPLTTLTDSAIEVRIPCEIPIAGKPTAARGRVVIVCNQPEVIAELNTLRDSANPDQAGSPPPEQKVKWRVERIESDLQEVENPMYGRPGAGGPGGPGGPPGGPGG
jgi:hypothetical protein